MGRHRLEPAPRSLPSARWIAVVLAILLDLTLAAMLILGQGSTGDVVAEGEPVALSTTWTPVPDEDVPAPSPTPKPTPAPAPRAAMTEVARPEPPPAPEPPAVVEEPEVEQPADVELEPVDEPQSSPKCEGLEVAENVVRACEMIVANVEGVDTIGGRAARPDNPTSCHPKGLATDLMVNDSGRNDKDLGDRIVAYVREHKEELGVTTMLWQVADHYDHVHLSFEPCRH